LHLLFLSNHKKSKLRRLSRLILHLDVNSTARWIIDKAGKGRCEIRDINYLLCIQCT